MLSNKIVDATRLILGAAVNVKIYRIPGYGPAYRAWSRWIHRHNRCVLIARGPMEDGARLWRCDWCGNRVREAAPPRRIDAERALHVDEIRVLVRGKQP